MSTNQDDQVDEILDAYQESEPLPNVVTEDEVEDVAFYNLYEDEEESHAETSELKDTMEQKKSSASETRTMAEDAPEKTHTSTDPSSCIVPPKTREELEEEISL